MAFFAGFAQGMKDALDRKWEREKFYTALAEKRRAAAAARGRATSAADKELNTKADLALTYFNNRLKGGDGQNALSDEEANALLGAYATNKESLVFAWETMLQREQEEGRLYGKDFAESVEIISPEGTTSVEWLESLDSEEPLGFPDFGPRPYIDVSPREVPLEYGSSEVNTIADSIERRSDRLAAQDLIAGEEAVYQNFVGEDGTVQLSDAEKAKVRSAVGAAQGGDLEEAIELIKTITDSNGTPVYDLMGAQQFYETATETQRRIMETDDNFTLWFNPPKVTEVGEVEQATGGEQVDENIQVGPSEFTVDPNQVVGANSIGPMPTKVEEDRQQGVFMPGVHNFLQENLPDLTRIPENIRELRRTGLGQPRNFSPPTASLDRIRAEPVRINPETQQPEYYQEGFMGR